MIKNETMPEKKSLAKHEIIDNMLRSTARSFYLTIRALPDEIGWAIGLAYLLARATDTVADELNISANDKLHLLDSMLDAITDNDFNIASLTQLAQSLIFFSQGSSHKQLLSHFGLLIKYLKSLEDGSRNEIISVMQSIVRGQILDVETFPSKNQLHSFASESALDRYTYLIAGSVGEFWSRICLHANPQYSRQSLDELMTAAVSFGKGLQLVNILRDIPHDLANGRCYFPAEQLQEHGIDLETLQKDLTILNPIISYWQQQALNNLREGWQYMLLIKPARVRGAIALPLMLAFATLHDLQKQIENGPTTAVKVSRGRVKIYMLIAGLSMLSTRFLALTQWTCLGKLIQPTSQSK